MKRLILPLAFLFVVVAPHRTSLAFQRATSDTLAFSEFADPWRWYPVVQEPGARVFRDAAGWESFWRAHTHPIMGPPPEVAFQDTMVIVLTWGCCLLGCGNDVEAIRSVVFDGTSVVVDVGSPYRLPCQLVIWPIQMVKIRRIDLPVVFTGETPATPVQSETWGRVKSLYRR